MSVNGMQCKIISRYPLPAIYIAVTISLLGENLLEEIESNLTLTFQLQLTGYSYGVIPVTVVPVSYSDFEILRTTFGVDSTLNEIAAGRVLPSDSALPCEKLVYHY